MVGGLGWIVYQAVIRRIDASNQSSADAMLRADAAKDRARDVENEVLRIRGEFSKEIREALQQERASQKEDFRRLFEGVESVAREVASVDAKISTLTGRFDQYLASESDRHHKSGAGG